MAVFTRSKGVRPGNFSVGNTLFSAKMCSAACCSVWQAPRPCQATTRSSHTRGSIASIPPQMNAANGFRSGRPLRVASTKSTNAALARSILQRSAMKRFASPNSSPPSGPASSFRFVSGVKCPAAVRIGSPPGPLNACHAATIASPVPRSARWQNARSPVRRSAGPSPLGQTQRCWAIAGSASGHCPIAPCGSRLTAALGRPRRRRSWLWKRRLALDRAVIEANHLGLDAGIAGIFRVSHGMASPHGSGFRSFSKESTSAYSSLVPAANSLVAYHRPYAGQPK